MALSEGGQSRLFIPRPTWEGRDHARKLWPEQPDNPEAERLCDEYLGTNLERGLLIVRYQPELAIQRQLCGFIYREACLDERRTNGSSVNGQHNSNIFHERDAGGIVDASDASAFMFNLQQLSRRARLETPGIPVRVVSEAHLSTQATGCAKHGGDLAMAIATARNNAQIVASRFDPQSVFPLYQVINTDNDRFKLYFHDDQMIVDTEQVVQELRSVKQISHPSDVFQDGYLDAGLDQQAFSGAPFCSPRQAMAGHRSSFTHDQRWKIPLFTHLLEHTCDCVVNRKESDIFGQEVFNHVRRIIQPNTRIPISLIGPMIFQILWNLIVSIDQENYVESLSDDQKRLFLDHSARIAFFGRGGFTADRGEIILANAQESSLETLHHVYTTENLPRLGLSPAQGLLHINVLVDADMQDHKKLLEFVMAHLAQKERIAHKVFSKDGAAHINVLTTYSRANQNIYFPVMPEESNNLFPWRYRKRDLMRGYNPKFTHIGLREMAYVTGNL